MLPYTSFDDAWGAPITPKIFNPYKDTTAIEEERRAQRSDVDVCREVLSKTMATHGCLGVRRLMGPSMCSTMDVYTKHHMNQEHKRRRLSFSQDDLMMILILGILIILFLRS